MKDAAWMWDMTTRCEGIRLSGTESRSPIDGRKSSASSDGCCRRDKRAQRMSCSRNSAMAKSTSGDRRGMGQRGFIVAAGTGWIPLGHQGALEEPDCIPAGSLYLWELETSDQP